MLVSIAEALDTSVSALLGETVAESPTDDLKVLSEKLEIINLQLARSKAFRRKLAHWLFIALCVLVSVVFAVLIVLNSPYLGWDFQDPETAIAGTMFHGFEWFFIRLAPILFIGGMVGIVMTRERA